MPSMPDLTRRRDPNARSSGTSISAMFGLTRSAGDPASRCTRQRSIAKSATWRNPAAALKWPDGDDDAARQTEIDIKGLLAARCGADIFRN
jgi:hypothetical protein